MIESSKQSEPEILLGRIQKIAFGLSLTGAIGVLAVWGRDHAVGFMAGAILSMVTLRSWSRLVTGLGKTAAVSAGASATFLALRYLLVAGAIYVIVNNLGVTPVPLIVGLLVSFVAVVIAFATGSDSSS